MNKIRAVILDFDGVLIESNEAKTQAFVDLFARYPSYSQVMLDYHLTHFSTPRMEKFKYFVYNLMGRPGEVTLVERMAQQFSQLVYRRVMACPEVLGARIFLEGLYGRTPLYISSHTPQDDLMDIVTARGFKRFFSEIYGNPPVTKPEAIRSVLEKEHLQPWEMVFIGDSLSDYSAAKAGGVDFIGRDSGQSFCGVNVRLFRDFFEIGEIFELRLT